MIDVTPTIYLTLTFLILSRRVFLHIQRNITDLATLQILQLYDNFLFREKINILENKLALAHEEKKNIIIQERNIPGIA